MVQHQAFNVTQGFGNFMVVLVWDDAKYSSHDLLTELYGTESQYNPLSDHDLRHWADTIGGPVLLRQALI